MTNYPNTAPPSQPSEDRSCHRSFCLALLAALLALMLGGCATSHEKRVVYRFQPNYGVQDRDFERMIAALGGGLLPGNKAVLLNNGDGFFPAILEAIRDAKRSINIELYIFAEGRMAETFVQALCAKAREGVQVRLLVDAMGERLGRLGKQLKAAGVNFRIYKPTKLRSIAKVSDRTHRKLIIVDGHIGFTGGLAVDDRWAGDARNPEEWRDVVVRVEGPAALQMQRLFLENWLYTTGELLEGAAQFPAPEEVGSIKAQAIGSSRTSQLSMAKLHYYMPIQAARCCIWIENAYWLPDKDFVTGLAAAAQRGVDVRIIVPGKQTDIKALRYAGRRTYRKLLEAGVRIYEFQPTMLHAKAMMVDDLWCSIGSINFTSRSMKSNAEANVAIYDRDFAKELRANMEADIARCKEITLEAWKHRGLGSRIQESYYRLYKFLF